MDRSEAESGWQRSPESNNANRSRTLLPIGWRPLADLHSKQIRRLYFQVLLRARKDYLQPLARDKFQALEDPHHQIATERLEVHQDLRQHKQAVPPSVPWRSEVYTRYH